MLRDYYEITTAGAGEIVSLADAKLFLRIDADMTNEDALIQSLITVAEQTAATLTNRNLRQDVYQGFFEDVTRAHNYSTPYLTIRRSPLVSITDVFHMVNGSWVALTSDDYELMKQNTYSRIVFKQSFSTFSSDTDVAWRYRVDFTAGYSAVPESIKTGIKQHVNFMYENRGDTEAMAGAKIPRVVKASYKPFKISLGV